MASHTAHGCIIWVVYQVGSHLAVILCLQTPSHLFIGTQAYKDTSVSMKVYCKCHHEPMIASAVMNLDCECQHELVFLPETVTQHAASLHHGRFEGDSCVESLVLKALGRLVLVGERHAVKA